MSVVCRCGWLVKKKKESARGCCFGVGLVLRVVQMEDS